MNLLIPNGIYKGTFQRRTSNGGQISNVTISFSANTWTGQSEFAEYPALCHGTYLENGIDSMRFENNCPWTAEFDWTLILSRSYKIKISGKELELTRDYNNTYSDIYKLTRQ
jgi:hypothetical protein